MGFQFSVLGAIEVRRDNIPIVVGAPKQRVLLASLLVQANRTVSTDSLVVQLWDAEPPGGARRAVHNYVMRLRRVLGSAPGPIVTRPDGYLIEVDQHALDVDRFAGLVQEARRAEDADALESAAELLTTALTLWRGDPLADVRSDVLQNEVVPRLVEQRLRAIELRVEVDLKLGRHADLAAELDGLTACHPLRERFWGQRMLALYRSGRQADALECYRTVRRVLTDELGVEPGTELQRLQQRMLTGDPDLGGPAARRPHRSRTGNLPVEVTSFVGRERQLIDGQRLLDTARLLTLTGVGGVGKTRLAQRLAAQVSGRFRDGVWLIDLAPLTEPDLLDRTVAEALGIHDQSARCGTDILVDRLRDQQALLIMDNCEHLTDAVAALVTAVLRATTAVRVLMTSRHRIGLPGEHLLVVPPLTFPAQDDWTPADVSVGDGSSVARRYEAVQLLIDRGAAVAAGFRDTSVDMPAVVQLCRRLDGIPLAIELAAVRLGTLSAAEILDRLDDRFRLLTSGNHAVAPYHRTLRGVVDWSYDLCTDAERTLWARLSVFAGDFDLRAAEVVCSDSDISRGEVVDLVSGLVAKSILTASCADGIHTRYRLPETIRQYGQERLRELGQDHRLRRRHHDYYHGLVAGADVDWFSPRESEWLDRLHQELPNIRTAIDCAFMMPDMAGAGLRLAMSPALVAYWYFRGTVGECRYWLSRALAEQPGEATPLRAVAVAWSFFLALCQGDQQGATALLVECRAVMAQFDCEDVSILAFIEGVHDLFVAGAPRSISVLARAYQDFRRAGRGEDYVVAMVWAMAAGFLSDREDAVAASRACLSEAEQHGSPLARCWALWCTGITELRHGQPDKAAAWFRQSLAHRGIDDRWVQVWSVEALAWVAATTEHDDYAARLFGAAHRLRELAGITIAGMRPMYDAHLAADQQVRARLGESAYAIAFHDGATSDDAVKMALAGSC